MAVGVAGSVASPAPNTPGAGLSALESAIVTNHLPDQAVKQSAVDNFRAALQGGKASGILPIKVSFAGLGPSLYLVSELTGENQAPSTDLNYQREKKAGGR